MPNETELNNCKRVIYPANSFCWKCKLQWNEWGMWHIPTITLHSGGKVQ